MKSRIESQVVLDDPTGIDDAFRSFEFEVPVQDAPVDAEGESQPQEFIRQQVIGELFATHHCNLCAFITRRVGNPDDAHDIVQHAFLEAYRCHGRYRGESNAKTWLYGIALNVMRNHLSRSQWRRQESLDDAELASMDGGMPSLPDALASQQDCIRVLTALEKAPEEQRETLLLVALEGFSYEEAAVRLGVAVGTVRSRVSRLRAVLRGEMETGRGAAFPVSAS
jgi:RNA polymerase sigma factor (sigma-70 family)